MRKINRGCVGKLKGGVMLVSLITGDSDVRWEFGIRYPGRDSDGRSVSYTVTQYIVPVFNRQ